MHKYEDQSYVMSRAWGSLINDTYWVDSGGYACTGLDNLVTFGKSYIRHCVYKIVSIIQLVHLLPIRLLL